MYCPADIFEVGVNLNGTCLANLRFFFFYPCNNMRSQRIFIGNLPSDTSESTIENLVSKFGANPSKIEVIKDNKRLCRGFAYCQVQEEKASFVISRLHGQLWKGAKLRVEFAKPDFLKKYNVCFYRILFSFL